MRKIIDREGHIDIFINNAGFGYVRALEQSSLTDVQAVFDVNYLGIVRCMKAVIPHMRERRQGHIATVSSVGGIVGQPLNEIYCSAKFAVE
jgi:short-subunit dehydrogenase